MKLIVGLGNPGRAYRDTRHNVGFMALDRVVADLNASFDREKYKGLIARVSAEGQQVMLLKPMTFMNVSGESVALAARNRVNDPADLLVVYDDVELPLGSIRIRAQGSAGTHNGMKSVIERVGTDEVPRLRMGVGKNSGVDLSDHVLGRFAPNEKKAVEEMVARASEAVVCYLRSGLTEAMNTYNETKG